MVSTDLRRMIALDPATYAHAPWALAIQAAGWALARRLSATHRVGLWLGAFAGAVLSVTREITQREWIRSLRPGLRRNMPDLAGFYVWEWNAHSIAETVAGIVAVGVVAVIETVRR